MGRTIALYADSGAGKTTQVGEYAKHLFKTQRKKTLYVCADYGGHDSIDPLIEVGIIDVVELEPGGDPWIWCDNAVKGQHLTSEHGLMAVDSGTSVAESLLNDITKRSEQVGQQKTQKFNVKSGGKTLQIGLNNEAHYGLVQTFMLDKMWESSWLTRKDVDVIWTFGTHRGESSDAEPLVGPKVAGKALTGALPKWFNYTFRIVQVPVAGGEPQHTLYLQAQPGHTGIAVSFGNARYPIDATTPLPASITPASLVKALELIESGKREAVNNLRAELGL